jgi:hypothetical protein
MPSQTDAYPALQTPKTESTPVEGRPSTRAAVVPAGSGRFALNLVSNVGRLGLLMLVGVWYVPFLVRQLGPAAYGLIPLTSMITSYMALVTSSLDTSVGRYLTLALGRKDDRDANTIFNVSLWGNVAIVALLALPAVAAVVNVQHLVRIPPGYETATRWLFAGTIAAFCLNQVKSPFLVSCFSLNRLDLQNVVILGETLTRVGLVAGLFLLVAPRIEYVGAGILAGTVVSSCGAICTSGRAISTGQCSKACATRAAGSSSARWVSCCMRTLTWCWRTGCSAQKPADAMPPSCNWRSCCPRWA